MTRLRGTPPSTLGGQRVTRVRDVLVGTDHDPATGETGMLELPSSNLIAYDLEQGRALARPSGTEPKFKVYYEVVLPVADGAALDPPPHPRHRRAGPNPRRPAGRGRPGPVRRFELTRSPPLV